MSCDGSIHGSKPNTLKILRFLRLVSVVCCLALSPEQRALGAGGDLLWQDEIQLGVLDAASSVSANAKQAFVGGTLNAGGVVRSYDRNTGTLLWEDPFNFEGVGNNILATALQGKRLYTAGTIDTHWNVRAYETKTGNLLWQDQLSLNSLPSTAHAVAVKDRKVFVAGAVSPEADQSDWFVRAYDGRNGTILWQDQFHLDGKQLEGRAIAVRGNQVFVAGGNDDATLDGSWIVRVYRASNGELFWEDIFGSGGANIGKSIAVNRRGVFVAGGVSSIPFDWLVRAYDRKTGAILWEDRFNAGSTNGATGIVVKGNRVFAAGAGTAGEFVFWIVKAYQAQSGSLIWQDQLTFGEAAGLGVLAITLKGSRVFAGGCGELVTEKSCDGIVRSYRSKDGLVVWEDLFTLNPGGMGNNEPLSMTVRRNRLFVVGTAEPPADTGNEWFVRAYQAR